MMVLDDKCIKCNYTCDAIHFQQNFVNWTSGNDDIDKIIQDTQLSAHGNYDNDVSKDVLEWIPYDRFNSISKIKFGKIYRANWIDGNINHWNNKKQNWERENQNMVVILKRLDNPNNIASVKEV
jgi:hypothetical protein